MSLLHSSVSAAPRMRRGTGESGLPLRAFIESVVNKHYVTKAVISVYTNALCRLCRKWRVHVYESVA